MAGDRGITGKILRLVEGGDQPSLGGWLNLVEEDALLSTDLLEIIILGSVLLEFPHCYLSNSTKSASEAPAILVVNL